jgi:hypothetical protein
VYVRVEHKGLPPGVQDGQRADARTEALWIARDHEQRLASGGKQDVVEPTRIGHSEGVERVRDGEDDVKVGHGQELALPLLRPALAGLGLTTRAMAVPARVSDHVAEAAVRALVEMAAER